MSSQQKVITITPDLAADSVAATTAYADKDVIGDHLALAAAVPHPGGSAKLMSIVLKSKVTTANPYDVWILNAEPVNTYGNNNSAFALNDADLAKVIGVIQIAAADHVASSSANTMAVKDNLELSVKAAPGSTTLYAIVISRGAVTFGAAGDLILDLGFEQQ